MPQVPAGNEAGLTVGKALTGGMKVWLLVDTVIVLGAGVQLYVLSGQTDAFFAWTIRPPLTAAFLGAGYLASIPLLYYSAHRTDWAEARLGVFGVFAFSVLTLAASLLHLDRFHLHDSGAGALAAAWIWLAVYVAVPPLTVVLTAQQSRVIGRDMTRREPMSGWTRIILVVEAAVLVVAGVILFLKPTASFWPWTLTALTGRAVAAWLVGLGIIAGETFWENDADRVHGALLGQAAWGCLQLVALLRYPDEFQWTRPSAIVYLVFVTGTLVVGVGGPWEAGRRRGLTRSVAPS